MSEKVDNHTTLLREAFALRLRIAVLSRFRTSAIFIAEVNNLTKVSANGFFKHWRGETMPRPRLLAIYAGLLALRPEWLENGAGEDIDVLRDAADAAQRGIPDHPDLVTMLQQIRLNSTVEKQINHGMKSIGSDLGRVHIIRHIPILFGEQFAQILVDQSFLENMPDTVQTLPLPPNLKAGQRAAYHYVADHDHSMEGPGPESFPPRTLVLCDPDYAIIPGAYVLARQKGDVDWILRRYKSALSLDKASAYTLEAINPSFEPIRVTPRSKWEIFGRAIFFGRPLIV